MAGSSSTPTSVCSARLPLEMEGVSSASGLTFPNTTPTSPGIAHSGVPAQRNSSPGRPSALLSFTHFHSAAQRRGKPKNHHRSLCSKSSHSCTEHFIRKSQQSSQKFTSTRLSCLSRHQRGVHPHTNPTKSSQIPGIFLQRSTLLLPGTPLRSLHGTLHLHEDSILAHPSPPQSGHFHRGVPGRRSPLAPLSPDPQRPSSSVHQPSPVSGVCDSSAQIIPHTSADSELVGNPMVWPYRTLEGPTRIPNRSQRTGRSSSPTGCHHTKAMGGTRRQNKFCLPGALSSSTALSTPLQGANTGTVSPQRSGGSYPLPSSTGAGVLDDHTTVGPHADVSLVSPAPVPLDGRFHRRLGCISWRRQVLQRGVEQQRTKRAHQRFRVARCTSSYTTVRYTKLPTSALHRQRGGTSRDIQETRQIKETIERVHLTQRMVAPTPGVSNSHQDPDTPQCRSRWPQSESPTGYRMATPSRQLPRSGQLGGTGRGGFIRHPPQQPPPTVRLSLPASSGGGHERDDVRLEPVCIGVPVPADQLITPGPATPEDVQRQSDSGGSVGSHSNVVPCPATVSPRSSPPPHPSISALSEGQGHPLLPSVQQMDRLCFLRFILQQNLSEDVVTTMLASYRTSSNRQHEVAWSAWKSWLHEKNVNVITVQTMLQFFQYLFASKKLAPHTISNYKNSLSWPLKEGFNIDLQHVDFSRLLKGFFNLKPPQPIAVPEWNLGEVLSFYENLAEPISVLQLFYKTLVLIALATGNRCSELSAFHREGLIFNNSGVTIPLRPHFLYKNQTLRRTPPPVHVPKFHSPLLCPVSFLHRYLESSSPSDQSRALFLHPKSSAALTAGRLGYWLVQAIRYAHNDRPVVKPHDVRKLAYSANWARKTDLQAILQHGFWASAHPFLNNYLVSLPTPLPHFVAAGSSI